MEKIIMNQNWEFRKGFLDSVGMLANVPFVSVNLPHDSMIGNEADPKAPASVDSGYHNGDVCNYTKKIMIPKEWEKDSVGLQFDGVMMHANVDVNGCKVGEHHYGYSPFYVDITDNVTFGEENRVTINVNAGIQPSSRWYTGCGLYRGVTLCHGPKVHVDTDGIYVYTKSVEDNMAFLEAQIDVCNDSSENRLVEVQIALQEEGEDSAVVAKTNRVIQVNGNQKQTARMTFHVDNPKLWDVDTPNLYQVKVTVINKGVYKTHFIPQEITVDEQSALFGIRTITADAVRGLRINGKTVKLKGGCVHHDNGLLGAVSLYESEVRRVQKLKEIGFNAIRTSHNPPSSALVEACDKVGLYIFDEAFDAWGMAKRIGDFHMYFSSCWEQELTAFIRRDRVHPSVIMWSTGNEIPERGGLNNGYTMATKLAETIRSLDATRPISNGICSYWSGLDDALSLGLDQSQNAKNEDNKDSWEKNSEPFTNGLDVVGYNYMEDLYVRDHELYPDRVILGSENFPKEIGFRWPMVEVLPYVIGDFTWTAWDYIGEAGIGKSVFIGDENPMGIKFPWDLMPQGTSPYPWRTANDADIDINGNVRPQGAYRSVVWGSNQTHVYAQHPKNFGKTEIISMWGFTDVEKCWNYKEYLGKPIEVVAFTNAEEAELIVNGKVMERKAVSKERPLPNSVRFQTVYEAGKVEVVSYKNGVEISRDALETTGEAAKLRLVPEKKKLKENGLDVLYVGIEILDAQDRLVPDASVQVAVSLEGAGELAGFGSANPFTEDNYTTPETITFHGQAMAVIRSGYESGEGVITVKAETLSAMETLKFQIGSK